jgi:ABC-type uncharacterized transport system substrate-binding protein
MKNSQNLFRIGVFVLFTACALFSLQLCNPKGFEKKKIVYVNSYNSSFPPSMQITKGVYETLPTDSFDIVSYFMDSKRNPSENYIKERTNEILDSIKTESPDLLIVSDDNAVKYLVVPNFQNDPMPIVFCGVNWTAEQYDLSHCNITGVLELLPIKEAMLMLKSYYPNMKKLLVLNENTTTSRKTQPLLDTLLIDIGLSVKQELVDDFEAWKSVFIEGSENYDAIYLQTRGAIKNWDHEEALRTIEKHIKVPLVTCEDFMMPYVVLGVTQVSKEQGMKAAEMAKKILKGTNPSEIPVIRNQMTTVWINRSLAEKINFNPDEELLDNARIID